MATTKTKKSHVNRPWVNAKPVPIEHVLAALETDESFNKAKEYWDRYGIKPSESWQVRATKEVVCDSLTCVEDYIELERPRATKIRDKLKAVRRRLEWTLWP